MVELRLQVLRTFFSPFSFIASTRLRSSGATYGPFFTDLLISSCLLTSYSCAWRWTYQWGSSSCGSCSPGRACPRGWPGRGGLPGSCPRRRRGGGRRGSWPSRGRWDASPCGVCVRPCRSGYSHGRYCPPGRW